MIRRYVSNAIDDSVTLEIDRVQSDLRNFHFASPHEFYYSDKHGIKNYNFHTKSHTVVQDSNYPGTWFWLRKKAEKGFVFSFWTSDSYGLMRTNSDSTSILFRYDFRHLNEWDYVTKHDIVRLEYLFGKTYLYMFVNDGRIWRFRV